MELLSTTMTRQAWAAVLRAFGIGNLLIAGLSVLLLRRSMHVSTYLFHGEPPPPFLDTVGWSVLSLNAILLGVFIVAGVDLLRLKLSAIRVLNKLFAVEATFLLGGVCLTYVIGVWSVNTSFYLAAFWLSWNFAISAQLLTGYALVAAIVLNLASKRLA